MSKSMLELYHADTSVCAQKVRLALAEKGLAWSGHLLDLMAGDQFKPGYLQLNPGAVVPTLIHDGHAIGESTLINEYLDEAFAASPLRPVDPLARVAMRLWTRQLDEGVHQATGVVSHGIVFRHLKMAGRTKDEVLAEVETIPDPARRERQREAVTKGLKSRFFQAAARRLDGTMARMEEALGHGPWLAGDSYSLADVGLTPYVTRLNDMRILDAGGDRPRLADWFDRIRARPSYETAIRQWAPRSKLELMAGKGAEAAPRVRAILQAG